MVLLMQRSSIREEEIVKLETIRDLKAERLQEWLNERILDAKIMAADNAKRELCKAPEILLATQAGIDLKESIRLGLLRYTDNIDDYRSISIVDAKSGRVLISTDKVLEEENWSGERFFSETLLKGDVCIDEISSDKGSEPPYLTIASPIMNAQGSKSVSGICVARISLEKSLYQFLLNRTGLGKTGENFIVNNESVALSELRWERNAPLRFKISALPAVQASKGYSGHMESLDYRGHPVLAAYTSIPQTGWGFVVKEDAKEVYEPILRGVKQTLIASAICVLMVCIYVHFIAMGLSWPIREMTRVIKCLKEGDVTARNNIERADELGFLALAANSMADAQAVRIEVEQSVSQLTASLVNASDLDEFGERLLANLMTVTKSEIGAFFIREGDVFQHKHSMGLQEPYLRSFHATTLEGEFAPAIASKRIVHVTSISEGTRFSWKGVIGTALPKEIVTIPILKGDSVHALISLASLVGYSETANDVLLRCHVLINVSFFNIYSNDEMKRLAHELREKNVELQAQGEELQAQSEELHSQTIELRERTFDLEKEREKVQEADRLKTEFLSNMSHELRTPLNSVMALSQLMLSREPGARSEQETEYLRVIERNGRHLLCLINDILDLSRIEAGRVDIAPDDFDPRDAIQRALDTIRPLAEAKNLKIETILGETPIIRTDKAKVHQILLNLLSNAVKFTDEGEISVILTHIDNGISICVRDTGIGISPDHQLLIFDEFRQVDGSATRKHEGTGLGLAIARRLARILGGDISVASVIDNGSAFTLILPLSSRAGEQPLRPKSISTTKGLKAAERPKVLAIDDDPEARGELRVLLESNGYDVITATNGVDGVRLAREIKPAVITLDILMSDMDGWEVMRKLKSAPSTMRIPIIVLTEVNDSDTARALGMDAFLHKPVEGMELLAAIDIIIAAQKSCKALLLINDNETSLKTRSLLEQCGAVVIQAMTVEELLVCVKSNPPNCIVLDLNALNGDGPALFECLASMPSSQRIGLMLLTGNEPSAAEIERWNEFGKPRWFLKTNIYREEYSFEIKALIEEVSSINKTRISEIKRVEPFITDEAKDPSSNFRDAGTEDF
jgi:signal transduction histidine kinase/response regulator RpfG family c-di-GMP phosphodiesterase